MSSVIYSDFLKFSALEYHYAVKAAALEYLEAIVKAASESSGTVAIGGKYHLSAKRAYIVKQEILGIRNFAVSSADRSRIHLDNGANGQRRAKSLASDIYISLVACIKYAVFSYKVDMSENIGSYLGNAVNVKLVISLCQSNLVTLIYLV